jgi:hypothetical protein
MLPREDSARAQKLMGECANWRHGGVFSIAENGGLLSRASGERTEAEVGAYNVGGSLDPKGAGDDSFGLSVRGV